ncbi:MAG TPA: alpha/beta fold hydrolase [Acidobacteriaceae bacterium]|jgi:hypothetical protein|nr:alpha/beta fold hydrolase [Acidobacteriaceae bacterium]
MAKPSSRTPRHTAPRPAPHTRHTQQQTLLVHPLWILNAIGAIIALSIAFAYGTLCLLFWQGQWQLVLHPSRTVAATPASLGLAFNPLRFGDNASGEPQLTGWWIPADNAAPTRPTALMLHSGFGSMSDALPRALTLHNAHLNVLLFDYRGFGTSAGRRPEESTMQADAAHALSFLLNDKHIPPSHIVLYGSGLGASLAVQLAASHHDIPALILDAPDGDFAERARTDPRSRLVPTRWLFSQTFPLADPLHTLATPKLLISYTTASRPPVALQRAANPRMTVELANPNSPALLTDINRFLDLYLH